jgi:MOSC domain-containing protein YiiM
VKLLSVNVGEERPMKNAKAHGVTGIFKVSVGEAEVLFSGLRGDTISDTENHGGPDQAVYVYGVPDYEWWAAELGRELPPGTFGENLTITALESAELRVGDRMHTGEATLEVTAPRIPCVTLAVRMEDPSFVRRFRRAGRPGVYCRVIKEGVVRAGDDVIYEPCRGETTVSVMEIFRDFFEPDGSEETVRRHLAAPIAVRDRIEKEKRLAEILARESTREDVESA